jgi:hypothetical protein
LRFLPVGKLVKIPLPDLYPGGLGRERRDERRRLKGVILPDWIRLDPRMLRGSALQAVNSEPCKKLLLGGSKHERLDVK